MAFFCATIAAGLLSFQLHAQIPHTVHNDTFNNTSGCAAQNAASVGTTSCQANFPGATDVCSPTPNSPNCNPGANTVMFDLAPTNLADFADDGVDIHSLVYPGYTGPVFVNMVLWHGAPGNNGHPELGANYTPKLPGPENLFNNHLLNGYVNDSDSQVTAQFNYMQRLKIDGIVGNPPGSVPLTLTGQSVKNHDTNQAMEKWKGIANSPNSTFLYSVMTDQVMWNQNCPGTQTNGQWSTQPGCVEKIMLCSLDYMNTATSSQFTCAFDGAVYSGGGFFADTHYWKVNGGHPVMSYFFAKANYFDSTNVCTAGSPCPVYNDNRPGTTCVGTDDCWNKLFAGIEHHISNTGLFPASSKPFIIHRDNFSAFDATTLPNNGSFRWFHATTDQTFTDSAAYTTWLDQGLSLIQANPSNPPVVLASGYGKVDFAQSGFESNLSVMDARCGQTFMDIMGLAHTRGFGPAPQTPLPAIEIVTWDDYDEGTEMETGIDNCLNPIQSSITGSLLSWSISFNSASGAERTIDHYTIYNTNDGSTDTTIDHTLVKTADVAVNTNNNGSYTFTLPSGLPNPTLIYVKAVGKPMLTNHLSAGKLFAPNPPAPGTGSITFSGDQVPADGTFGYIDLSVNNVLSCEVVFQQGDLPWDVANRMATAINNGCTSFVTASADPFFRGASQAPMVMTAKTAGANTNYAFSISYRPGDPQWFTLTPSGPTLTGGHN